MPGEFSGYAEVNSYNNFSSSSYTMLALVGAKYNINSTGTNISAAVGSNVDMSDGNMTPTLQTKINQKLADFGDVKLSSQFRTRTNLINGDTKCRTSLTQTFPINKNLSIYSTEYVTTNFKGNTVYGIFSGLQAGNKYIEGEFNNKKEFMVNLGINF